MIIKVYVILSKKIWLNFLEQVDAFDNGTYYDIF